MISDLQPNVLFLMADQHNARCISHAGNGDVMTPNLDRLALSGTRFEHAFVQNPICTPSRISFLSGQYPHNHGYFGLSDPRAPGPIGPKHLPSLFSHFRAHGYRTAVIGKTHTPKDWLEPHLDRLRDCMGFLGTDGYAEYLAEKGILHLRDDRILSEHRAKYGETKGQGLDARCSNLPLEDSVESWVATEANHFMSEHAGEPWVAWVSFPRPHQVWTPSQEFWDMYSENELVLPPNADDPLDGKPPHQGEIRRAKGPDGDWYFEPRTYEAGRLRVLRGYYALVSQTDHFIGVVLDRLEELGLRERTIVVYTADHGDFAGEHGFIEKAPGISYDAITRVPFIWSWPGHIGENRVSDELVESIDLLPTLLNLAGLPELTSVDGRVLAPITSDSDVPGREAVFTETPWVKCVRTREWKLVDYPRAFFSEDEDVGELYHVSEDPWELENCYTDPECRDIVISLRRLLWDWMVTSQRVRTTLPSSQGTWEKIRWFDDQLVSPSALQELINRGQKDYM